MIINDLSDFDFPQNIGQTAHPALNKWKAHRTLLARTIKSYVAACTDLGEVCSESSNSPATRAILAAINSELRSLAFDEQTLTRTRASLAAMRNKSLELAHINVLPPEILLKIFAMARSCCVRHGSRCLPLVSNVCTYWRQLTIDKAELWNHIDVGPEVAHGLAERLLERTGDASIHVHFYEPKHGGHYSESKVSTIVRMLIPHMHRVSTLELETYNHSRYSVGTILSSWLEHGNPNIARSLLVYRPKGYKILSPDDSDKKGALHCRSDHAKAMLGSITKLHLQNTKFDWDSTAWGGLVDLRLSTPGLQLNIQAHELFNILSTNPNITTLVLRQIQIFGPANWEPPTPVPLAHLKVLSLFFIDSNSLRLLLPMIDGNASSRDIVVGLTVSDDMYDWLGESIAQFSIDSLYLSILNFSHSSWQSLLESLPAVPELVLDGFNMNFSSTDTDIEDQALPSVTFIQSTITLEGAQDLATYSGVPVYEMICKSVAVMRRRSDGWLNATQILKVAGFDKPQRTRVLEREVQKGEHEKVQGGYGKYQGTWVPLERGLILARQYNVETQLKPIIDFTPAASSPPLAPKHLTALPSRARQKQSPDPEVEPAEVPAVEVANDARASEDGSLTASPSEISDSSRTPSPIVTDVDVRERNGHFRTASTSSHSLPASQHQPPSQPALFNSAGPSNAGSSGTRYADIMLEYFISDTNQIPSILVSPPPDFEPDVPIDDDGHTALHWACAMGRIRVVKLLLSAGADIFKENKSGQTPLMRSVMFANNYDVRKFPELYELLHRSTLNVDNFNRTVFHHVIDVAMSKGKAHAARYYMETLLSRLSDFPDELADVINFQDDDGETALTMAARCRSKRLVKILLDHGADPKIANKDGKTTEDYIFEDERFRTSPTIAPAMPAPVLELAPQLHYSKTAQRTTTKATADAASLMASLAAAFDAELVSKERDLAQAHALLTNIQGEILESQRAVAVLKAQGQGLEEAERELGELEEELRVKMGSRYRMGWEKWLRDEEARDRAWKATQAQASQSSQSQQSSGAAPSDSAQPPLPTVTIDLAELYAPPPKGTSIAEACDELRAEIAKHRTRRHELFDEFVRQQADSGTSGRMAEYRRLISAAAGGVPMDEVDGVVPMLLEQLESEEATLNVAWAGQTQNSTRPSLANNAASISGLGPTQSAG